MNHTIARVIDFIIGKIIKKDRKVNKITYFVKYGKQSFSGESKFKNPLSIKKAKKSVLKSIKTSLPIKEKIDLTTIKITGVTFKGK